MEKMEKFVFIAMLVAAAVALSGIAQLLAVVYGSEQATNYAVAGVLLLAGIAKVVSNVINHEGEPSDEATY